MDLLDVLIIICAIGYGFGGFRSGAIVGLFSTVGFFGGAAIGAQLAEPIGSHLVNGRAQVPIAIVCVLFFAMAGQLAGVWIAGHLRARVVRHERTKAWDSGIGSGLGVLSVLLVAWMIAVPLASSPYPELASQATHSRIVRAVDGVMPDSVRNLYRSLRSFLDQSQFPRLFGDLPNTTIVAVPPPPTLSPSVRANIRAAEGSIFKITSEAPSCDRQIEGSGFVYAKHLILTNAHVVAGANAVSVQAPGSDQSAQQATVVLFDPRRDVAVLYVPTVDAKPLPLATKPASSGQPAVVLGYPENGPFTAGTARVRSKISAVGNDIYGRGSVRREVYALRADVRSGNSGGPLMADDGTILGVVFERALDSSDTGFALTMAEISNDVQAGLHARSAVSTQRCAAD